MSASRTEFVMCGIELNSLLHGNLHEIYEDYLDDYDTLRIIITDPTRGETGYVIGHVLYESDGYDGFEATELIIPHSSRLRYEINTKLKLNCELEDIKLYAFTCWN